MNRPSGVTVSAVFLFIGSLFVALSGGVTIMSRSEFPPIAVQVSYYGVIMGFAALVLFGLVLWGVVSAIGLLRMRMWARTSMLVIGVLLMIFGCLAIAVMLYVWQTVPELQTLPHARNIVRLTIGFYILLFLLGLLWDIYFSRARVRAAFLEAAPVPTPPVRPLSITVIAWHAIIFAFITAPWALTNWPAFFLWMLLTGWVAKLTYLLLGAAQLAIGIGLLKLKPWSHLAAVWFSAYGAVQSFIFVLLPNKWELMAEALMKFPEGWRVDPAIASDTFRWVSNALIVIFVVLTFGVALWYLLTRKKAFFEAAKAAQPPA